MILDQILLQKHSLISIHEPWMIPELSFGEDEILGMHDGKYVNGQRTRGFLLKCNHIITDTRDMGGVCNCCLIEAEDFGLPHSQWCSLACSTCFLRCTICSQGFCREHSFEASDGRWYCASHIGDVTWNSFLEEVEERRGKLTSTSLSFFGSLFFGDKKLLK